MQTKKPTYEELEHQIANLKRQNELVCLNATLQIKEKDRHVTALMIANEQLKKSVKKLKKMANQLPGMVYQFNATTEGYFSMPYCSDNISELFKLSPEQVRDDATALFALIHADDYEAVLASLLQSKQNLTTWLCQFRVCFDKNAVRWFQSYAIPQTEPDGSTLWSGFITDITEQKWTENTLRENQSLLNSLIDSTPSSIFALDLEHRFTWLNNAMAQFYGLSKDEILGKTLHDVFPPDIADQLMAINSHIMTTGESFCIEEVLTSKRQ